MEMSVPCTRDGPNRHLGSEMQLGAGISCVVSVPRGVAARLSCHV